MTKMYSPTPAGYRAWLADGHSGNYKRFLRETASREGSRNELISELNAIVVQLTPEELEELMNYVMRKYPTLFTRRR